MNISVENDLLPVLLPRKWFAANFSCCGNFVVVKNKARLPKITCFFLMFFFHLPPKAWFAAGFIISGSKSLNHPLAVDAESGKSTAPHRKFVKWVGWTKQQCSWEVADGAELNPGRRAGGRRNHYSQPQVCNWQDLVGSKQQSTAAATLVDAHIRSQVTTIQLTIPSVICCCQRVRVWGGAAGGFQIARNTMQMTLIVRVQRGILRVKMAKSPKLTGPNPIKHLSVYKTIQF